MIDMVKFNHNVDELEQLLRAKLGLRGSNLAARLAKAGRRLPKRIHQAGSVITQTQISATHPKLARLQDQKVIDTAFDKITSHLETIDPKNRRKGLILGIVGGLVFNLILLVLAIVVFLRWQGVT